MGRSSLDIAIVGAGFSGIGTAIRLRRAGITSFTVFDKSDRVGGTWRDNTYPGSGCDVPSHLYSYSFERRSDWSRHFPKQPEILDYLEDCVDRNHLRPHLRLGMELAAATWDDHTARWTLRFADGSEHTAHAVVFGLGQLNRPRYPDIPGHEAFRGEAFHSARWNHDHDLTGRRVAVVGNGASAIQFAPHVVRQAAHVTQFQRSANWIGPKPDGPFTARQQWLLRHVPGIELGVRARIYATFETRFLALRQGSRLGELGRKGLLRYLETQVSDPDLRAKLTPDYPVGCKRILISNDYLRALTKDNVDVVTEAITTIDEHGLVTADGTHHEVDTIIYATGFESTGFLEPVEIRGRGGRSLHEEWAGGADAYLGTTVHGYPNLFVLYGPNTNLGHNSIIYMVESQLNHVLGVLSWLRRDGVDWAEPTAAAQAAYNADLDRALDKTVWAAGCDSWYKTASGRITNNWPDHTFRFRTATRHPDYAAYTLGARSASQPVDEPTPQPV